MNTIFVCLGKIGDVLSLLPLLEHYSKRDKQPVNLLVARQYKEVVEGLSYINPVEWDGHWQDLNGAIAWAKRNFDKVIAPQTYGKNHSIEHRTPSFQYDQWLRAEGLHLWDKLPLTIPRRNHDFVKSILGDRPAILVADKGESSSFEDSGRLVSVLRDTFGVSHQIVRLGEIRLDRFTDFVSLYDAASAIVVTETAHLHLSKSCKTPVFALVTDKPERWHGSAWSSKFKLHIRYSQYPRRERELIEGIRSVL